LTRRDNTKSPLLQKYGTEIARCVCQDLNKKMRAVLLSDYVLLILLVAGFVQASTAAKTHRHHTTRHHHSYQRTIRLGT